MAQRTRWSGTVTPATKAAARRRMARGLRQAAELVRAAWSEAWEARTTDTTEAAMMYVEQELLDLAARLERTAPRRG